ncbi:unnamed protein product [Merluccius merluccius]
MPLTAVYGVITKYVDMETLKGQTALFLAAAKGHVDIVKLLVTAGANMNIKNASGLTPILAALSKNKTEVAKVLLQQSCLHLASAQGSSVLVSTLVHICSIELRNNQGKTAIYLAAENGHQGCVEILACAVGVAMTHNTSCQREAVRLLIAAGARLNEDDWMHALALENTELLELILQHRRIPDPGQRSGAPVASARPPGAAVLLSLGELRGLVCVALSAVCHAPRWLPRLLQAGLEPSLLLQPNILKVREVMGWAASSTTAAVQQLPVPSLLHHYLQFSEIQPPPGVAEASVRETAPRPYVIPMRRAEEGAQPARTRRGAGVCNQTRSLLYKNLLIKWRTKQQSLQELILPLLLLGLLILISALNPHVYYSAISTVELDREDHYFLKGLGYTPITNITSYIMEEVAQEMHMQDRLEMFSSEEDLENASLYEPSGYVGVVFLDSSATSYRLRYPYNQLPLPSDYTESIANCFTSSVNCRAANYWYSGFIRLQSLIDATIIQMQSKRSVWSEMNLRVVMMGQPGSVEVQKFSHALISIYLVLTFMPFVTFLIVNVAAEKEQRLKDTMTMMGLYDTAFWLSWGLLYAALVTTMSILMAVIATYTALFPNSDFFVIFLLIFLYGISSIFFSFMLTPLFKKPKFASTVGSMLTVVFGCLSLFTVLMNDFPQPLVWLLCLLSPSAFSIGIAQVVYLEAQGDGALYSTLTNGPHPLYVPLLMLVLDCVLYLLLAIYLDQVLPGEFRMRRSLLYFLKPSYWSQYKKRYVEVSSVYETEVNGAPAGDEPIEPVSPEFRGKEAIRINNIRKVYKEKDDVVEALRGLTFDIYEGQITALLGHSGAGKSTLMNILCGISQPTSGSATIYGQPVAEIADGPEMKQLVGMCPQFNIIFDVLTVEEHLRIFAAIKGILPADVNGEVRRVLKDLDMEKIMDAQAKNLSGGQKRKLSVGIAILGDPKILLLDEPTAGMDPCSRHQVWTLLKKRRAGRVTVLSTHYMDEADILADRKAVISQGQLKCVGSSLYLKTKCGVGYHLRMSVSEGCKTENITLLVKQHVPKAKLSRQQDTELTFTLPFESMDTFPGLFSELDSQSDLGVVNYGVSMTTLEDVFLRLEAEAEVDQADYSVFNQEQVEEEGDTCSLDDTDQRLLTFSDGRSDAVAGHALWRQQFSAVAWLHMLNMRRERKAFIYTLALFLVFVLAVLVLSLVTGNIQIHSSELEFLPIYLLKRNQAPRKYATSLLVQNSSDSDISNFIHNLESQNIKVELMKQNDYMAAAPHSAAINVTGSSKVCGMPS